MAMITKLIKFDKIKFTDLSNTCICRFVCVSFRFFFARNINLHENTNNARPTSMIQTLTQLWFVKRVYAFMVVLTACTLFFYFISDTVNGWCSKTCYLHRFLAREKRI